MRLIWLLGNLQDFIGCEEGSTAGNLLADISEVTGHRIDLFDRRRRWGYFCFYFFKDVHLPLLVDVYPHVVKFFSSQDSCFVLHKLNVDLFFGLQIRTFKRASHWSKATIFNNSLHPGQVKPLWFVLEFINKSNCWLSEFGLQTHNWQNFFLDSFTFFVLGLGQGCDGLKLTRVGIR